MNSKFPTPFFPGKFAWLFAVGLLIGCAPLQNQGVPVVEHQEKQSSLVPWAATHTTGSHAVMDDSEFGRRIMAELKLEYRSASGLNCKLIRVRSDQSWGEDVSVCRGKDGDWFLAPRIWANRGFGGVE